MNATESTPCTDLATLIGEHHLPCQSSLTVQTWPRNRQRPTMWAPKRVVFETDVPEHAPFSACMMEVDNSIVDNQWVETRRYIGAWGCNGMMVIGGQMYTIS